MPDLALFLATHQLADRVADRRHAIRLVNLVQRNAVDAEPAQACLDGRPQMPWTDIEPRVSGIVERHAALGGDHDLVSSGTEGFRENALGVAEAVHVGDVEEVDAGVEGAMDRSDADRKSTRLNSSHRT